MSDSPQPVTGTFDWDDIRRRLAALDHVLDPDLPRSAERTRALLDQRTARLAEPLEEDVQETIEVLRFVHAGQSWVIETRYVAAVMSLGPVTPLPGAGDGIVGVAAWRGEPLVIRELTKARAQAEGAFALVLGIDEAAFAVPVDAAPELTVLPRAAIRDAPARLAASRPWLMGVTEGADFVIDGSELIAPADGGDVS